MASEIRVNQIQNRSGLGTITLNNTGVVISGVTTITNLNTSGNINISAGSTSAPSLSPTGDPNTGIFFPSADTVCIGEGGTEVIRVDSSSNVGIKTSSTSGFNGACDDIVVSGGADIGVTFYSTSTTGSTNIAFTDTVGSTTQGAINYSHNGDYMIFQTSAVERVRIDSSGRVLMPYQAAIELNGNNGVDIDFTANAQLLTSTYYNQVLSRGGMSWNSSTGSITVPVTGYYSISIFTYCNTAGNGDGRIQIRSNSSARVIFQMRSVGTNTATVLLNLAANDTVDVIADSFDLPRLYMGPQHTRFNMFLLG